MASKPLKPRRTNHTTRRGQQYDFMGKLILFLLFMIFAFFLYLKLSGRFSQAGGTFQWFG